MDNGATAAFYQISAPPRDRLFAITDLGLVYSDDAACGWGKAQGMLAGKSPPDYFPDAANPNRVWAVRPPDASGGSYTVVESLDAGNTFATVRFTAAAGDTITGLEIARSNANVAFLTIRSGAGFVPKLATTKNGGATWDTRDLSSTFGNVSVRIISVDPTNASKLLLRVSPPAGDGLAMSLDGGQTFVSPNPLTVPGGILTSFARLANGTLILGGADGVRNVIFRSKNGGTSFTEMDAPPVRGLGTRDGRLFIVSSNDTTTDGFAVGESIDEGQSWRPLLHYADIQAIEGCVKALCRDDCTMKAGIGLWPAEMCDANPTPRTLDGGATDARTPGADAHDAAMARDVRGDGAASPTPGGGGDARGDGAASPTPGGGGCSCAVADADTAASPAGAARMLALVLVLVAGAALARPRGRSRSRSRCRAGACSSPRNTRSRSPIAFSLSRRRRLVVTVAAQRLGHVLLAHVVPLEVVRIL